MKKKILIVVGIILCLWLVIFLVDYVRCSHFKEPIFIISKTHNDLQYSDNRKVYTCNGLGYQVEVEKSNDETLVKVEMYMFGKFLTGAIAEANIKENEDGSERESQIKDIVIIENGKIQNENLIDDFIKKTSQSNNQNKKIELNMKEYKDENLTEIKLSFYPGNFAEEIGENAVNVTIPDLPVEGEDAFGYYVLETSENKETKKFSKLNWEIQKQVMEEKVQLQLNSNGKIETLPVICFYDLDSSNYSKKFELNYYQRKDMGAEKIVDNTADDNYDFDAYTIGGDVVITIDGDEVYDFKDVLEPKVITVEDILNQADLDSEYGICEKGIYSDGGSIEYRYDNYTILKYDTLEENKDFVIGPRGKLIDEATKILYQ